MNYPEDGSLVEAILRAKMPDELIERAQAVQAAYWQPYTSDKLDDECWPDYWTRKRHELHGPDCSCILCRNEDRLPASHALCDHTYLDDPDIVQ